MPPGVQRWIFEDPVTAETYVVAINPERMTSPFPQKNMRIASATARSGEPLVAEGTTPPAQWSFAGHILDDAHYEALRTWVYDHPRRIWITDHFGRRLNVYLLSFDVEPRRGGNRYWRHYYTISALVYETTAPTVGLTGA